MNPNPLTDPRNRNYLIAGAGAAVAVIAFFLPFVTVSVSSTLAGTMFSQSINGAQAGGILWLLELLLVAAAAAAALFIFKSNNPFGMVNVPLVKQARWTAWGFVGIGGGTLLITLLNMLNASSAVAAYGLTSSGFSVSWGFGVILFLLGAAATTAGGVLLVMNKSLGAGAYPYQGNPYAPGEQPQYPPTGYPGGYQQQQQPPQYPSQTPYPPTTYPPQQPQYPPQQQPPQYPQQ